MNVAIRVMTHVDTVGSDGVGLGPEFGECAGFPSCEGAEKIERLLRVVEREADGAVIVALNEEVRGEARDGEIRATENGLIEPALADVAELAVEERGSGAGTDFDLVAYPGGAIAGDLLLGELVPKVNSCRSLPRTKWRACIFSFSKLVMDEGPPKRKWRWSAASRGSLKAAYEWTGNRPRRRNVGCRH